MLTELAGRDDPDPTLVALTPIGLWGVREMLLEQGAPAPLVGELAGEDVEYVCVRLAGARREVAEAELTAWVAARSPRAAADELARLLRRTDEPAHRELALYALRRNGERRDGDPGGAARARPRGGGLGPARSPSGHGTRCGPVRLGERCRGHPGTSCAATLHISCRSPDRGPSGIVISDDAAVRPRGAPPDGRAALQPLSAAATTSRASSWIRVRCSGPLKLSA